MVNFSVVKVSLPPSGGLNVLPLLLSFAVGGLLGDVFLHLLPEAWSMALEGLNLPCLAALTLVYSTSCHYLDSYHYRCTKLLTSG